MARTFPHCPNSLLSCRKFSFSEKLQLQLLPTRDLFNHQLPITRRRRCAIYACSIKKSRGSRKIKSNAELCYEIRDFVEAVGLPEGHVPSLKELSRHGRNDLAHVVRRRGYKLLRELLTNSTNTEETESKLDTEKFSTAQDDEVNDAIKDLSSPIEGSIIPEASSILNNPSTSNSNVDLRIEEMDPSSNLFTDNLEPKDDTVSDMSKDVSSSVILPSEKNSSCSSDFDPYLNLGSLGDQHIDPSPNFLLDEEASYFVNGPLEKFDYQESSLSVEKSGSDENSSLNAEPAIILDDPNNSPLESSINISLEEKVANFIRNGDLGTIDDNFGPLFRESDSEENKGYENAAERNFLMGADYTETEVKRNMLTSRQIVSSTTVNPSSRFDPEELTGQFDKNLNIKMQNSSKEKQLEISHLKFMLHQKELELSHLKEQIEEEKHALSLLQTKAETEIGKAQQLISEKDAELLAVEESLSGLEEVQVQYCGEGEIVEMAGSFNGWQHRIKMDRQPASSNIMDPIGSRKFRLWSAVLWLYPGVYEIKFIVDGNWKIDPQRETTNKGSLSNNILRVGM